MAKINTEKTILELIIFCIGILTCLTKFFIEVNKHSLWKECVISISVFGSIIYSSYLLYSNNVFAFDGFILGIISSFIVFCIYWKKLFNKSPYKQFSQKQIKINSEYWDQLSWWWKLDGWQFEEEVAKIFILNGYHAIVTKGSGDGGVDIILKKDGYKAIVQCKHYKNPVPPEPIRALWGCKDDFEADEVILVASSGITQSGADFTSNKPNFIVLTLEDIIIMGNTANQNTFKNFEEDLQETTINQKVNNIIGI